MSERFIHPSKPSRVPYRQHGSFLEYIAAQLAGLQDWCWAEGLDACLSYARTSCAGYVLRIHDGDVDMSIDWWHYGGDPHSRKFGSSYRLWNPTPDNLKRCVRRHFFG